MEPFKPLNLGPGIDSLNDMNRWKESLLSIVSSQAKDEGLWFVASTGPEAYLQQELRMLHRVIECDLLCDGTESIPLQREH